MCWLKNLHFTLRRACTHVDHLATHIRRTHAGNWPLGCWSLYECNKEHVVSPPLHPSTSRACSQFRGYLKNQRQTKTLPPPTPPPIQRGRAERQSDRKRNEERKSTLKREEGVWIQASTRLSERETQKKGREWKESGSRRDVLLRPELSVCVYSAS